MLTITKSDAVAICIGIGYKSAGKWNRARMERKFKTLASEDDYKDLEIDEDIVEDKDERDRLNKLLKSLRESKGQFELVKSKEETSVPEDPLEDEPEKDEPEKDKPEKDEPEKEETPVVEDEAEGKTKKSKKKAKAKKAKKAAEVDEFGNRLGTEAAAINVAMVKADGPKTIQELCEMTGLSRSRISGHVGYWKKHGYAKVTKEGTTSRIELIGTKE